MKNIIKRENLERAKQRVVDALGIFDGGPKHVGDGFADALEFLIVEIVEQKIDNHIESGWHQDDDY